MVKKPHKISNPDSINRNNRIFFEASRESRLLRARSLSISYRNPPPYNVPFHAGNIAVGRISFRKQIINLISFHPSNSVVKTVSSTLINNHFRNFSSIASIHNGCWDLLGSFNPHLHLLQPKPVFVSHFFVLVVGVLNY